MYSGSAFSISFQSDMMMETVSWPFLSNYSFSFHTPVCNVVCTQVVDLPEPDSKGAVS